MKQLKPFLTLILSLFLFSSVAYADIRLVGDDKEPGEPMIVSSLWLSLNTQIAGQFTLEKNSHLSNIAASISGTGSLLVSVYSNNELTNLPDHLVYNASVDIASTTRDGFYNLPITPIELEKGTYWIVMEPLIIIEQLYAYENYTVEPLARYGININNADWQLSNQQFFSLVIDGHPTGRIAKNN